MMVFKRKQIVVLSLICMIVIAGYLQYIYQKSSVSVSGVSDDAPRLGEAVYVDNEQYEEVADKDNSNSDKEEDNGNDKVVQASQQANEFFAQAKIDKDVTRGKNKEELENIVNDPDADGGLKSQANEKILSIIDKSEREMAIENLIKEKGYNDVVVFIADNGSLDIVVKTQGLSDFEATQIADIASRHADVAISDVYVRDIF